MAGGFNLHDLRQDFGDIQGHAQVVGNQVVHYGGGSPDQEYAELVGFTNGIIKSFCPHGYVETAALKKCQDALDRDGICLVVGWPGTGKTTLCQELLRNCENLQPLQLRRPEDWNVVFHRDRSRDPAPKTPLIFIDNVCEQVTAELALPPAWANLFTDMTGCVGNGQAKVILSFRERSLMIVQQKLGGMEILKRARRMDLDKLGPSDKEKVSIYRNMITYHRFIPDMSPKRLREMASQPKALGFPECCSLYFRSSGNIPKECYLYSGGGRDDPAGAHLELPDAIGAVLKECLKRATEGSTYVLDAMRPPHVNESMAKWDYRFDVKDNTVLHFIAMRRDEKAMERALNDIPNVVRFINHQNAEKETALHIAVKKELAKSVELLLKHGADPTLPDAKGNTAFHCAALQRDPSVVRVLCRKKRAMNSSDPAGVTLLQLACSRGSADVVRELVAAGADVTALDEEGCTCLHHLARNGKAGVLEALGPLTPDILNARNSMGRTALSEAAVLHSGVVQELLRLGADDMVADTEGELPIMAAIKEGNEESARALLKHSPTIATMTNQDGDSLLHLALKKAMVGLAKAMMRNGTDVTSKGSLGNTPLMLASAMGDLKLVEWMLKRTECILTLAEKNEEGETAVDIAAKLNHEEIVEMLVAKGTELNLL